MNQATVIPNAIESHKQTKTALVEETITKHKRGRVKFMGTYWFARFLDILYEGEALPSTVVKVVGREGLTLLVVTSK
jgi:membrane protein implicated in regulation of membrane protease activity